MNDIEVRQRLREMMVSIGERRMRLASHVGHREEALAADFAEQAIELENEETMVALDEQLQHQARSVQAALARLELGIYGVCDACGEAIDPRRLEALPATARCFTCANRS